MATMEIQMGALTLQPGRQLLAEGVPVPLGRKSLDLLSVLAGARGALVTKDELMEAVWPGLVVEENAIQAHVTALRKALGSESQRLQTVRGFGYRLEVAGNGQPRPAAMPAAPDHPSVAVLPFANLTGDAGNDYLADGMAEELICTLTRSSDLKVPARTSTFGYKGRDGDIRQIARELGVAAVLEGSVRSAGARIRVTAQLIDAESGFHLWSANYDSDLTDIIALQDEIAGAIAGALRARLAAAKPRTADPEAYHLFLRGRSLIDRGSGDNLLKAVALLEEAVRLDPDYADPRVALSRALVYCCSRGVLGPEQYAEALEQARIACEIDPLDAGAHAQFGCGHARIGDWVTAATHLRKAISLNELDADFHCVYGGGFLTFTGHVVEGERHVRRARALAPASAQTSLACAISLHVNGKHGEGEQHVAAAIELGFPDNVPPLNAIRAASAQARGDHAEAARQIIAGWPAGLDGMQPDLVRSIYAANAGAGPRNGLAPALSDWIADARARGLGARTGYAAHLLLLCLLLDDLDLAREVTDLVLDSWSRTGVLEIGSLGPFWSYRGRAKLRDDHRLEPFFREIGLEAYWQAFGPPEL